MVAALVGRETLLEAAAGEPGREGAATLRPGVKQLFLDNAINDHMSGLRRIMRRPRKYSGNPVLKGEFPYERSCIQIRDAPLWNRRAKQWEMRYFGAGPVTIKLGGSCTCLAISRDGLRWEKPMVGRFEFDGSKNNNLAHPIEPPKDFLYHVLYDAKDPDPQRALEGADRRAQPATSRLARRLLLDVPLTGAHPIGRGVAPHLRRIASKICGPDGLKQAGLGNLAHPWVAGRPNTNC